ncbi:MAG TPA: putative toxin-antitoxin system toxin component, PIN family [Patescibacteria group bacterium]|nr:putative toxin-antitoxin system toxin component, PIN family [Patescibacteria group bacterium]
MHRIVLDTNIFVSGAALSKTPPSQLLDAWRKDKFILVTSPQIIKEIKEVLLRPKVLKVTSFTEDEAKEYIEEIEQRAFITDGSYSVEKLQNDPDDNMILACAIEGKADFIITGDKQSLLPLKEYHGIKILTAADYVNSYLAE